MGRNFYGPAHHAANQLFAKAGIASLKSLRTLDLEGMAVFTADGILGSPRILGPDNKGLILSMKNFDEISRKKQELIEQIVTEKVKGYFDFKVVTGDYWHD
ncbi:hypothetical protein MMC29_006285 [Sticta canariensis]|nr:hypothetical protein [Sticta canariensis]